MASLATLLLAITIILHSAFIVTTSGGITSIGDPMFIVFAEILAWLLILISLIGFKVGCMSAEVVKIATSQQIRRRRFSFDLSEAVRTMGGSNQTGTNVGGV